MWWIQMKYALTLIAIGLYSIIERRIQCRKEWLCSWSVWLVQLPLGLLSGSRKTGGCAGNWIFQGATRGNGAFCLQYA